MHVKIATVSGCIRTGERIPNTDRRFGAALEYVVAYLLQAGQDPQPLLFTVEQLRDAVDRAKTNPEDCPPFEPEQVRIARAVEAALIAERERVASQAKYAAAHQRFVLGAMALVSLALGAGIGALL
jgi:hypothetical protein